MHNCQKQDHLYPDATIRDSNDDEKTFNQILHKGMSRLYVEVRFLPQDLLSSLFATGVALTIQRTVAGIAYV